MPTVAVLERAHEVHGNTARADERHEDRVDWIPQNLRLAEGKMQDLTPISCKKLKRSSQRPYSGKLMLRIDPGIHAKAAMRAEAEGKSLNAWAQEALNRAISAS